MLMSLRSLVAGRTTTLASIAAIASLALAGCGKGGAAKPTAASASASAKPPSAAEVAARPTPLDPKEVAKIVNPKGEKPYAGKTGTLRGVVRMEGDPAPESGLKFPAECGEGAATYGRLFRVGPDNALADAMVAVTGYDGFVPARDEAVKVTIHGCAFNKRTVVATFGQRIQVANLDPVRSYMPYLDGGNFRAIMVAIPGGDPVKLYPQQVGHYMLRDELPKEFLVADVFVLKYATTDVTGLDGHYEVPGIPVGKVKVTAYLPVLAKTVEKDIEIKEGDNDLDLTLSFDATKDLKGPDAAPATTGTKPAAKDAKKVVPPAQRPPG
jgi:hypothetical protein